MITLVSSPKQHLRENMQHSVMCQKKLNVAFLWQLHNYIGNSLYALKIQVGLGHLQARQWLCWLENGVMDPAKFLYSCTWGIYLAYVLQLSPMLIIKTRQKVVLKVTYSVIHISIHPSKELCSKMAPGEVGVSHPCPSACRLLRTSFKSHNFFIMEKWTVSEEF